MLPIQNFTLLRPNKKIPIFRVTRPYLNLLVKPRIFLGFLEEHIILYILKGEMSFKMHEIIFFSRKICVSTLPKLFRPFPGNILIFLFGLMYSVYLVPIGIVSLQLNKCFVCIPLSKFYALLWKLCRFKSAGFWYYQLKRIHTVFYPQD